MNDRPLFQNTDEQEAAYAPEQLSGGVEAGEVVGERGAADATTVGAVAPLPIAATGGAVNSVGPGYAGGTAGTATGTVPALGALALAAESEESEDAKQRD
jgi:hypothetical protein